MSAKVVNISEARARRDAPKPYDTTSNIIAFESGTLDEAGVVVLFQHLVNTGIAWKLQGTYGRAAAELIERGLIQPAVKKAVAAAPGAASVRVWEIMSRGRGPRGGRAVPEGASVAYAKGFPAAQAKSGSASKDSGVKGGDSFVAGITQGVPAK